MIVWTPMSLDNWERIAVEGAMQYHHKVKAQAARTLGISPRTLDAKLELYAKDDLERQGGRDGLRQKEQDYLTRARAAPTQFRGTVPFAPDTASRTPITEEHVPGSRAYIAAREKREAERGKDRASEGASLGVSTSNAEAKSKTSGASVDARIHVESASGNTKEPSLPVPERQKVQEVLPRQHASSGPNRRR